MKKYKIISEIFEMLASLLGIAGMFQVNSTLGWAAIFAWLAWIIHIKAEEMNRDELRYKPVKEIKDILKDESA